MTLQELLYTQGFGTRRVCAGLVEHGHVALREGDQWTACDDPWLEVTPEEGWPYRVQGVAWAYHRLAYLLLHKPAGVKRMLAATGHEVVSLHRSRMGQLDLPADVLPGQWRWLSAQELAAANSPLQPPTTNPETP
ncbi:MAG: hypothetical protein EB096_00065 [Betaproteobacteria bacterium]|nr:hypothetical protein [Betaproteobacteria bacterium]